MTFVPVGVVHVGCIVTLAVGTEGAFGTALTVSDNGEEIQPVAVFLAVTKYVEGIKPLKVPEA